MQLHLPMRLYNDLAAHPPLAVGCSGWLNGKRYSSSHTPSAEEPNADEETDEA